MQIVMFQANLHTGAEVNHQTPYYHSLIDSKARDPRKTASKSKGGAWVGNYVGGCHGSQGCQLFSGLARGR